MKILMPQLVTMLAEQSGKQKRQAEAFLKAFFSVVTSALEDHDNVKIKEFGTFKATRIEARKSVNISTGSEVNIPAHYKINFTPSKTMAEKVNREFSWLDIVNLSQPQPQAPAQPQPQEPAQPEPQPQPQPVAQPQAPAQPEPQPQPQVQPQAQPQAAPAAAPAPQPVATPAPQPVATPAPQPEVVVPAPQSVAAPAPQPQPAPTPQPAAAPQPVAAPAPQPQPVVVPAPVAQSQPAPAAEVQPPVQPVPQQQPVTQETPDPQHQHNQSVDMSIFRNKQESEGERLGEELEKDFGEIQPVEPFGPIEPDSPDDSALSRDNANSETGIPVPPPGVFYVTKEEFSNLITKNDMRTVQKAIRRVRGNVDELDAKGKKRMRNAIFWSVLLSVALTTGGFFIFYQILLDKFILTPRVEQVDAEADDSEHESMDEFTDNSPTTAELSAPSSSSKGPAAPTTPSDIKATDKVTNTRYLTTMAKEHYGNYNFWPYIYLENEAKLGHPDRIKPGTVVVIPYLDKYDIDPTDPADIEKAKQAGIEIYKKYQ